jgi:serine/threonine-protein kinase mTOR
LALRDPNLHIREAAAEALKAALESVANRQASLQEKYYEQILEEANRGFKANTVEHIHGSLLGLGELLSVPGSFIQNQFRELCDRICRYKDHRDKLIRRTVITLLPKLAASNPNSFVLNYRHMCINYLLSALRKDDRAVSFIATGKMAIVSILVPATQKKYLFLYFNY